MCRSNSGLTCEVVFRVVVEEPGLSSIIIINDKQENLNPYQPFRASKVKGSAYCSHIS